MDNFQIMKRKMAELALLNAGDNSNRIILTTPDVEKNIQFINKNPKLFRGYRSYFLEYYYEMKIFNTHIKKRIKTDDIVKNVIKKTQVFKGSRKLERFSSFDSVICDAYFYNKIFFTAMNNVRDARLLTENTELVDDILLENNISHCGDDSMELLLEGFVGKRVISEYLTLLQILSSKYRGIGNQAVVRGEPVMLIDVDYWKDDFTKSKNLTKAMAKTPASLIYNIMQSDFGQFSKLQMRFMFSCGDRITIMDPATCEEGDHIKLRSTIRKMAAFSKNGEAEPDKDLTLDMESELQCVTNINNKILGGDRFNFVGDGEVEKIEEAIEASTKSVIRELNDKKESDLSDEELQEKIEAELNKNVDLLASITKMRMESVSGTNDFKNNKRNQILAERQMKLKIASTGKTLGEILSSDKDNLIKPLKIKTKTVNQDMHNMKFPVFAKTYNETLMEKDTLAILNFFQSKRNPIYILDIKKEDTSDGFDHKFTYKVKMETAGRKRYTLEFDFPKMLNDQFLYLGGNVKSIVHQAMLKPISKTGPDTVQLVADYNKVFVRRTNAKLSAKIEKIKKVLIANGGTTSASPIFFTTGDNSIINASFKTTMEYDEMATYFSKVKIGDVVLYFNQDVLRENLDDRKIKFNDGEDILPIGLKGKNVIYLNTETGGVIEDGKAWDNSLSDYMIDKGELAKEGFSKEIEKATTGKKFVTTEATIMERNIPTIFVTCYMEGITTVFKKANIKYEFYDTRIKHSLNDRLLRFKDCYVLCKDVTIAQDMLLNGLFYSNTELYDFADFDKKETYLDIFDQLCGTKMILNAFENFYDLFINPVALEVLQTLHLPEDFVGAMLYANELLADNQFESDTSLNHYRIRGNEILNAHLYSVLATAYAKYRGSLNNKNPTPFTIDKNAVINDILSSRSVEDYSDLSPVAEAEKVRAVSFKGLSGMNQERAYTIDKRSYDPTYRGVIGMSSAPSGAVGIVKEIGLDANIISARGYIQTTADMNETGHLDSSNQFTASELLTVGCATHDDAPRVSMQYAQSKHMVPCSSYNKMLLSNGADEIMGSVASDNFAFKAKQDGIVTDVDRKEGFLFVTYKDGSKDAVDIGERIAKNSGGGTYINNTLKVADNIEIGKKIEKGQILAYNSDFFSQEIDNSVTYKSGVMHKFAIMANANNFEDSGLITTKLAKQMTTYITAKKEVVIGKNSNIDFIALVGTKVKVGDPLLVFDESFEDDGINQMLASLGKDNVDSITDISKQKVKSKYAGTIKDVRCYYTIDKSEFSESTIATIDKINQRHKARERKLTKVVDVKKTNIILSPTDKVTARYGKIKGTSVNDGLMIEFMIEYPNQTGISDKIVNFNALKATIGKIIDPGLEPYSEYRPNEEISNMISPISYWARMTDAIMFQLCTNKYLIEGGRQLADIILE